MRVELGRDNTYYYMAKSNKDKKKKKKSKGRLHVQLKEARNLPAKDANGFSDPFVKRYIV